MNIKTGFKLAQVGVKGLGKGVARGGKELAVIAGKAAVLAVAGAVITYATRENDTELKLLAARRSKTGIDELESEIADIVNELERENNSN